MITIGGWLLFGIIAFVVVVVAIAIMDECCLEWPGCLITGAIALAILASTLVGLRWYFTNTESGARAIKDQESNLKGGISRVVEIYDMEGDLIKSYKGEFDVEMHDTYILFDDEEDLRHVVYFTTGTVVIDELPAGGDE